VKNLSARCGKRRCRQKLPLRISCKEKVKKLADLRGNAPIELRLDPSHPGEKKEIWGGICERRSFPEEVSRYLSQTNTLGEEVSWKTFSRKGDRVNVKERGTSGSRARQVHKIRDEPGPRLSAISEKNIAERREVAKTGKPVTNKMSVGGHDCPGESARTILCPTKGKYHSYARGTEKGGRRAQKKKHCDKRTEKIHACDRRVAWKLLVVRGKTRGKKKGGPYHHRIRVRKGAHPCGFGWRGVGWGCVLDRGGWGRGGNRGGE